MNSFRKFRCLLSCIIFFGILFMNFASASDSPAIQKKLSEELALNNSIVIELQQNLGSDYTDIRIETVTDDGVWVSLSKPLEDRQRVLIGFDGSINQSPVVFSDGLAVIQSADRWGFITKNYEWKIPPVWEIVYPDVWFTDCPVVNGYALARGKNKSVIINSDGEIVHYVPDAYISLAADNETVVCYNDNDAYLWEDNHIVKLDLPQGAEKIYFEEAYTKSATEFVVGTEKIPKENNIIYHVFNKNGKLIYSIDCNKAIGKSDGIPNYVLLNNGGLYVHIPGNRPFVCDGNGVAVTVNENFDELNYIYSCMYDDYIWNFETCYDRNLNPIFEWEPLCDYNKMIIGSGKNYIAFMPAYGGEKLVYDAETYHITPGSEIVVVLNENANPKDIPDIASAEKIKSILENTPDRISVYMNENKLEFDTDPILIEDRVLVPMRKIFEEIGANVEWNDALRCAIATKDDLTVEVYIGKNYIIKNGKEIPIDVSACIMNNRTLVPLRAISEALGLTVEWIDSLQMVSIMK